MEPPARRCVSDFMGFFRDPLVILLVAAAAAIAFFVVGLTV